MEKPLGQRLRELSGSVLLTGHTGFKGTWMTFLLEHLEIPVVGYSLNPEKDSLYTRTKRSGEIPEVFSDIRNYEQLEAFIDLHRPTTVIHMAAQPLVLESYENPRETFDINVMGTVNLLDIAFKKEYIKSIVVVTTDKVYLNENLGQLFKETDSLNGKDPYSASKVAAESAVSAWYQLSKVHQSPRIVSVRAGNVIGGGDFSGNRVVPDIVRGYMNKHVVNIRNPKSSRPWQHVLDPLIGYLMTLEKSLDGNMPQSINFGPNDRGLTVEELVSIAQMTIDFDYEFSISKQNSSLESKTLDLDSGLAKNLLSWEPRFPQQEAIKRTFIWWDSVIKGKISANDACIADIKLVLGLRN